MDTDLPGDDEASDDEARDVEDEVAVGAPPVVVLEPAVLFDDVAAVTRRLDDELRRRPRWRVDVSNGRCVDAGLSCNAHHSVLL